MSQLTPVSPDISIACDVHQPASAWARWASHLILAPLFALATTLFGTAALLVSTMDRKGHWQHRIARCWASTILRIMHSPVKVVGAENLSVSVEEGRGAIYAVNHLSYMDTPVVFSKLPFQFRILARHDLFRIPFIGWYLRRSGQIPVDTTHVRSSVASLNRGIDVLKHGMPLVIFPEGGRSPDGHIHEFMSGVAFMAIRARVPVVPVALVGTYELMPMHTYHVRPRPLFLVVGKAISPQDYTPKTADALMQRIHAEIARMYDEYTDRLPETHEAGTAESI